jgi:hypothetical protein
MSPDAQTEKGHMYGSRSSMTWLLGDVSENANVGSGCLPPISSIAKLDCLVAQVAFGTVCGRVTFQH